jgi:DNA primase
MKYHNDDRYLIDYDIFLSWIEKHFGTDYHQSGEEIKINSIFVEDKKYHLWCNPKKNAFHCWKSDKGGSLVDLVAKQEGISYKSALSLLGLGNSVRHYEMELLQLLKKTKDEKIVVIDNKITLPEHSFLITELSEISPYKKMAIQYLQERKLPMEGFYVCVEGKYKNRIIIPYYSASGDLQYWNGRDLTGTHLLRYWGPTKKECGVGKEDFVYFYKWPKDNEVIYLTEGEFDAVSLNVCGLNGAAAGGKNVSEKQTEILSKYQICVAFDNDESGKNALHKFGMNMLRNGKQIRFVRPPMGYKDWNLLLKEKGENCIKEYISANTNIFDEWTIFGSGA